MLLKYRKQLAAGTTLLCALAALPATEARGAVDLNWLDNDGTSGGWLVSPGATFTLTLNVSSSEALTGVDYFLESPATVPLGGSAFIMQNRDMAGSLFVDPWFTDTQVEIGPANQLNPRTDFDLGASINNVAQPVPPSTYMLARYTIVVHPETTPGSYNIFTVSNPATGWIDGDFNEFEFDHHADYAIQVVTPQWNRDLGGSWNTNTNWSNNVIPNSTTTSANFLNRLTAPSTVSMDGNKTLLTMNIDSPISYTISRGSGILTMSGTTPAINVERGSHTISTFVTWAVNGTLKVNTGSTLLFSGQNIINLNRTLTRTGGGMLTITGAQPHQSGAVFNFNGGTTNMNVVNGTTATATTAAVANLTMQVSGTDALVNLGADQNLRGLNVQVANAGDQGLNLNSPATAGQFRSLRVYAVDLAAAKTAIWGAVISAGANPGDGIFDSGLAAHPNSRVGLRVLPDLFGTQHVLVRPAVIGDLNFDGQVSISDFIDLAANFNTGGATWEEGDVNADGSVSIADFIDLASNFGALYAGGTVAVSSEDAGILNAFAAAHGVEIGAVPEPGMGFLMTSLAGILLYRRRNGRAQHGHPSTAAHATPAHA